MASTHLAKIGIRNLKIVKTLHMDRHGDENEDARDYLELDNADDFDYER